MGAWLSATASQSLLNTGALEIYYDGEVIFSARPKAPAHDPEIMNGLGDAIDRERRRWAVPLRREALRRRRGRRAEETAAAGRRGVVRGEEEAAGDGGRRARSGSVVSRPARVASRA